MLKCTGHCWNKDCRNKDCVEESVKNRAEKAPNVWEHWVPAICYWRLKTGLKQKIKQGKERESNERKSNNGEILT